MQIISSSLADYANDRFLRCDIGNIKMRQEIDLSDFPRLSEYLFFLETGKPISREDYASTETDSVHLTVRNIIDGSVNYENSIYICAEKSEELLPYRLSKGDIVLAISSNCGSCFLYEGNSQLNITLSH